MSQTANIDPSEIKKFEDLASRWWDEHGEFKPLHEMNPLRLNFINSGSPLDGKTVCDIGCGGGILSESIAKCGAATTGLDMGKAPLSVARLHAMESELDIDYQQITAEEFARQNPEKFDVVDLQWHGDKALFPSWRPLQAPLLDTVRALVAGGPARHRQGHPAVPRGLLAHFPTQRRTAPSQEGVRPRLVDDQRRCHHRRSPEPGELRRRRARQRHLRRRVAIGLADVQRGCEKDRPALGVRSGRAERQPGEGDDHDPG